MLSSNLNILNQWIKYYWKTIASFCVILILSTIQISTVPKVSLFHWLYFDKVVHFILYFTLANVWFIDVYKKNLDVKTAILYKISIGSILYGILMEIVQKTLVQNRSADVFDALANTIGIIVALLLLRYSFWYRNKMYKFLMLF